MKDYARIVSKICETPWLITINALALIMDIVDERVSGNKLTDEEIAIKLQEVGTRSTEEAPQVVNGLGVLSLYGPIFGKANLMTQLSGATSLETFQNQLRELVSNEMVRNILIDIDSPGGTSDLVREVGEEIKAASEVKPVYAMANTMMASAAYWLASQATMIYSVSSGSVGGIGVYTVHEDRSGADAQQGRRFTYISAGPYKTEGNPHQPLSAEGAAYRQEVIGELYDEFLEVVAEGRKTTKESVETDFGGGRLLTAKKALEVGAIDGITTFENLTGSLQRPQRVSIAIDKSKMPSATAKALGLTSDGSSWIFQGNLLGNKLEVVDWEHSEPGTGTPPQPRKADKDEPDVKGGWRRDPLPVPIEDPNSPKASSQGRSEYKLNPDEFRSLLGLSDTTTDEEIMTKVTEVVAEYNDLKKAVGTSGQEKLFAEEYPEVWSEHQELRKERQESKAKAFVDSVKTITRAEGDKQIPTSMGLSALALNTITDAHKRFAQGVGTITDFEEALGVVLRGGLVEFGEVGSSTAAPITEVDTSSPIGVANARKLFADKVAEVQSRDDFKGSYLEAITVASKMYPDLADAYKVALPA